MTSSVPAFGDPSALAALLKKWSAPDDLREILTQKGFRTIASVAYAIPAQGSPDDFLRVLWPPADPADTTALVTPSASFARRLLAVPCTHSPECFGRSDPCFGPARPRFRP